MSKNIAVRRLTRPFALLVTILCLAGLAQAQSPVTFTKAFDPATIGPGSTTTLTFTIANNLDSPQDNLAFTDNLPAGMTIASPSDASTTCADAVLSAPDGGTTIGFGNSRIGAFEDCEVVVNVTATTTSTNTSGDLTWGLEGNSGPATASLTVDAGRPGFSKSFAPDPISLGQSSTLTFVIDNSNNGSDVLSLTFTDNLPSGMVVATPANASTDCGNASLPASLTADAGTATISLFASGFASFPALGAGTSCSVAVDVTTTGNGIFNNVSLPLTIDSAVGSGFATARLSVELATLTKSFTDDPVPPGGNVTLEFTLTNIDRTESATNISFTDDVSLGIGIGATDTPQNDVCGAGSQLTGTNILSLTGGELPPGGSCTFSATLAVPGGANPGTYTNTTSTIALDVGGQPTVKDPATDILVVSALPVLEKTFTDDPVIPGGTVTLEFRVENTSTQSLSNIAFSDNLSATVTGLAPTSLPSGFCNESGTMTTSVILDDLHLDVTGMSLGSLESCTFDVALLLPLGAPSGAFTNTTSSITGLIGGGTPVEGLAATDDLIIVGGPSLSKSFTDDPTQPGGTVTLEFTLTNSIENPQATGIAFTDTLDDALTGLVATDLPKDDVCGTGSQISGTSILSFTGGTLDPGASCTFSATLQVPPEAPSGSHTNWTSNVAATVGGLATVSPPATDVLVVTFVSFSKAFSYDPVPPGSSVQLAFTITNDDPDNAVTDMQFADNLGNVLLGLTATDLPKNNVCGTGSVFSLIGSSLWLQTGSVDPGSSCTFFATLSVPAEAAPGSYGNVTSGLTTSAGTVQPATDFLVVGQPIVATKSFTDDPVAPGGTVTLEFDLENVSTTTSVTNITFTDTLETVVSGLQATDTPINDVCGAGSVISGTGLLTLSGGSLAPGQSCTFSVTLDVPAGASEGDYTNTTSTVAADFGGSATTSDAASDDLQIRESVVLSMSFTDDPVEPGDAATLEFTIENNTSAPPGAATAGVASKTSAAATDISFSDDLTAVLPGLTALGLPTNDVCGAGSLIDGTTMLSLTGGNLAAGTSCTFSVAVQVPGDTPDGTYRNDTGPLTYSLDGQSEVGNPATDQLVVGIPQPVELSRFEAIAEVDRILLTWSTASETDNAGFSVEMSLDGEQFVEQGWVDGEGTTVELQEYSYIIETSDVGLHFVRLRQVDYDGAFEYGPVVEVLVELGTTHRLGAAYPNPFGPSMAFTLTIADEQQVRVGLYDVMGREVKTVFDGILPANRAHTFRLDAGALASGLYLYRVVGENFDESRQVTLISGSR